MSKHTPGPWKLETVRTSVGVCHQIGPLGSSTKLHSACLYDDCYSDRPGDLQLLADARLVAAAPDMLDALKAVYPLTCKGVDPMGDCCGVTFTCHHCRLNAIIEKAIAKAEGGQ